MSKVKPILYMLGKGGGISVLQTAIFNIKSDDLLSYIFIPITKHISIWLIVNYYIPIWYNK